MNCGSVREKLPGYIDGALHSAEHAPVRAHLDSCVACRQELERYHRLSALVSRVERPVPPADLAVRVRLAVSRERNKVSWARQKWGRAVLVFQNVLEPLAVPATGGTLTSLLIFGLALQSLFSGLPMGAVPNDLPTNLLQPARVESLAPFAINDDAEDGAIRHLVVEATLDEKGSMVNYQILAGPDNRLVRRQLDQALMLSRFRPQMSFGRPVSGGRVVVSFSEMRVRG